jgi:hypothetical protein
LPSRFWLLETPHSSFASVTADSAMENAGIDEKTSAAFGEQLLMT